MGFRLCTFELAESRERRPRRDARQAFAYEYCVGAHAVFPQDVREVATVRVEPIALDFETNPAVQDQLGELVARRACKRSGRVEAAPNLRRVDAKQPHPAERRHVDRVAVEDGAHQHGI